MPTRFPFHRLQLSQRSRWYLLRSRFFSRHTIRLEADAAMQRLERIGSSHFYLEPASQTLFKFARDKYAWHRQPLKWLAQDLLEKRLLAGGDAVKEWRSNRILHRAGLDVVECRGVGIALNPFNPLGSVYAMAYLPEAQSGETHFKALEEAGRRDFVKQLCREVIRLANHGYYHRDLHYGNFLVDAQGKFVWIDTHVRRLPKRPNKRRQSLVRMLSVRKLQGTAYRNLALDYLERHYFDHPASQKREEPHAR